MRELLLKGRDILLDRDPGMHLVLQGIILSRETKRVPAHRVEHRKPAHTHMPRVDIGRNVALRVPHVEPFA